MQAKKSQEDLDTYDIFECLNCETVISKSAKPDSRND